MNPAGAAKEPPFDEIPREAYRELIELCYLARTADRLGLAKISERANLVILQHKIPPEKVLATVGWCESRAKMLTGYVPKPVGSRDYTEDEVFDLMKRYPKFLVACMQQYPGKTSTVDLAKVTVALRKGKIKAPELW